MIPFTLSQIFFALEGSFWRRCGFGFGDGEGLGDGDTSGVGVGVGEAAATGLALTPAKLSPRHQRPPTTTEAKMAITKTTAATT